MYSLLLGLSLKKTALLSLLQKYHRTCSSLYYQESTLFIPTRTSLNSLVLSHLGQSSFISSSSVASSSSAAANPRAAATLAAKVKATFFGSEAATIDRRGMAILYKDIRTLYESSGIGSYKKTKDRKAIADLIRNDAALKAKYTNMRRDIPDSTISCVINLALSNYYCAKNYYDSRKQQKNTLELQQQQLESPNHGEHLQAQKPSLEHYKANDSQRQPLGFGKVVSSNTVIASSEETLGQQRSPGLQYVTESNTSRLFPRTGNERKPHDGTHKTAPVATEVAQQPSPEPTPISSDLLGRQGTRQDKLLAGYKSARLEGRDENLTTAGPGPLSECRPLSTLELFLTMVGINALLVDKKLSPVAPYTDYTANIPPAINQIYINCARHILSRISHEVPKEVEAWCLHSGWGVLVARGLVEGGMGLEAWSSSPDVCRILVGLGYNEYF